MKLLIFMSLWVICCALLASRAIAVDIIVAEGERFKALDNKGWKITRQDDSYGSHTYGGMWMTNGGCMGAPAESVGSVATQTIRVKADGKYRVWSKYQSPPYFNYLHKIEITQDGKTLFSHVYGALDADRLWSFGGVGKQLWWPWGVDHDAAEAPREMVELKRRDIEIRLITVANAAPAGDRFVDFVLLTTSPEDKYEGYPSSVGSPFANEALAATELFMRFKNTSTSSRKLTISKKVGHFQPNYGASSAEFPDAAVTPGTWSEWFNMGPFCRLVHDEGLWLNLENSDRIQLQISADPNGMHKSQKLTIKNGEVIVIPKEITWLPGVRIKTQNELAQKIIDKSKTWPKANDGVKSKELVFYGSLRINEMRDALGYNTLLPDQYEHVSPDIIAYVGSDEQNIRNLATSKDKSRIRLVSFGDEISLGSTDFKDLNVQAKYHAWLAEKKITSSELGTNPSTSVPIRDGTPRQVWYSTLFEQQELFAHFRHLTEITKEAVGPNVLTGANYSPHGLPYYYGSIAQWIDLFKYNGMSMFWTEDYIFSMPELPQTISWMFAEMQCATKYNNQPIHLYVMPHAPGQTADILRRNMIFAAGAGARDIDNFCVAPAEEFTENSISWSYPDQFRVIHNAIYQSAEAEKYLVHGKPRPAKIAIVLSRATEFNESRLLVPKEQDPFAVTCQNAPAAIPQTLCRKDQQYLYLALKRAHYNVDLITEDDIVDDNILSAYKVVYFAGEWIDSRVVTKLDQWVQSGGVLFATAGLGKYNQFNEPDDAMLKLLGLKSASIEKNAVALRTTLEIPLAKQIGEISIGGQTIPAIGMRQTLVADDAKTIGTWQDGSAGVTERSYGKGKVFAVGTLAGHTWIRTGLKAQPFARGGNRMAQYPDAFDLTATNLALCGVNAVKIEPEVMTQDGVEAIVRDSSYGSVVTLVNWKKKPIKKLSVSIKMPQAPSRIWSVSLQKSIPWKYTAGKVVFDIDLKEADFVLLKK
jgi:hypothetical protein